MSTINSRLVYTRGELYRMKNYRPDFQFNVLNALVLLGIRRRRGCREGKRKLRNIEIINTHWTVRHISQRHLDSWRLPILLTVRCQQSSRLRSTIQDCVDSVSCVSSWIRPALPRPTRSSSSLPTLTQSEMTSSSSLKRGWRQITLTTPSSSPVLRSYEWTVSRESVAVYACLLRTRRVDFQVKMENTEFLWFVVTLVTGLMMTICASYHPPKPIYDVSNVKSLLADNISCLLDNVPDSILSSLAISTNWIQSSYSFSKDSNKSSKYRHITKTF